MIHNTAPVLVWVDVDIGIVAVVRHLNTLPGIRTYASCQGTIGEGGPHPFPAYVMVSWEDEPALEQLRAEYDVTIEGGQWGLVRLKSPSTREESSDGN